jgi:hypothetical protein
MNARALSVPAVAAACLCAAADASIAIFTEAPLFDSAVAGMDRVTETFGSFADGTYPSPLSGSQGPVSWLATANLGLRVNSGRLSAVGGQELVISFQAGSMQILGVGGNFFGTSGGVVTTAIIQVQTNDGTAIVESISSPTGFMGFVSGGASISSIRISLFSGTTAIDPTADNLSFAYVPAPGSIVLLAASLLMVPRRRR